MLDPSDSSLPAVPAVPAVHDVPAMQVGVSCRKGGSYFNKRNKGFYSVSPTCCAVLCWHPQHKHAQHGTHSAQAQHWACFVPKACEDWCCACAVCVCVLPTLPQLARMRLAPAGRASGPTCLLSRIQMTPATTLAATATTSAGCVGMHSQLLRSPGAWQHGRA